MSKKKSTSKAKGVTEMLDDELISSPKTSTPVQPKSPTVNMKEFAKNSPFSFSKQNYRLLLIGLAVNVLGFLLMIGGATDDPSKFDGDALFSHTRITIAPMLIVAGYIVIFYAIMRRPKGTEA